MRGGSAGVGAGGGLGRAYALAFAAEGAKVAPVVLESDDGNTIIWVVDQETAPAHDASAAEPQPGDRSDEVDDGEPLKKGPAKADPPKGGEL